MRTYGWLVFAALAVLPPAASAQVRVKDVATLNGYQPVPLVGYGLVIGLNKTGDRRQTMFTAQSLAATLERLGVSVVGEDIKIENTAAVLVTAELPPFARAGARLDVTASSIGDARSLQGGVLVATALRGPDGSVHALAQGALSIGGFGGGTGATNVQVNHLTVGRVPAGAFVQVGQKVELAAAERIQLSLRQADFSTAHRLADAIAVELGSDTARAVDAGTVEVAVPPMYRRSLSDLMARIEPLRLNVDTPARVVINERTGTVVIGSDVRLGPAAVAHGNLSVKISTRYDVSQPLPYSRGETTVVPREKVEVDEGSARLVALPEGVTLADVVSALNALGVTPRDIIAIMQALKESGALRADLVIM
jgi:flagellar P-ring protein precursor FlgI